MPPSQARCLREHVAASQPNIGHLYARYGNDGIDCSSCIDIAGTFHMLSLMPFHDATEQ